MCQDRRDGLVASPRPPPPGSAKSLGGEIAAQRPPVGWAASPLPSASRPPAPLLAPPPRAPPGSKSPQKPPTHLLSLDQLKGGQQLPGSPAALHDGTPGQPRRVVQGGLANAAAQEFIRTLGRGRKVLDGS